MTYITKATPAAKLGIKLRNVNGRLYISSLAPKRVAAKTLLKPCDRVLVINGIDCRHLSSLEASDILRSARKGVAIQTTSMARRAPDHAMRVSYHLSEQVNHNLNTTTAHAGRAEFISAMAWKPTAETRLGIRFQSIEDGSFVIMDVDSDGLFGNSALQVGDRVLTINDIVCAGNGYQAALSQARNATGPIAILAQHDRGSLGMVTATISKASASTRIGIGFKNIDGKLCVSFCETPVLTVGDRIVSINGVNCSLMSHGDAIELIRRAPNVVTIVATRASRPANSAMVEVTALIINQDETREMDQESLHYDFLPRARSVRVINEASESPSSREESPSIEFENIQIESGRARFTSVMVWKPTPQAALGLKFMSYDDGSVRISGIDPHGLFADSTLRVGDHVVSINDISCSGNEYHKALYDARRVSGAVQIVVCFNAGNPRFVTASIVKAFPSTQVGIGFKNQNGRLCVGYSSIALVDVGDLPISINGVDCRSMRADDAAEMILRALQVITIKVESPHPTGNAPVKRKVSAEVTAEVERFDLDEAKFPCAQAIMAMDENSLPEATISPDQSITGACGRAEFISAMVWKATPQTVLGIRFQSHEDGSFRISTIEQDGLFAESPLAVGDYVISINKVSCRGKRHDIALRRLRATSGAITIVVRNKGGNSGIVTSSITKPTPSTLLGIGFQNVNNNRLCVSSLQAQGICCDSLLSSGHKIISINGVDCRFLSSRVAADMVRLVSDVITIVAEIPVDSGVVVAAS
jgi:predicted metalloprotease with PDZ domain